MDLSNDFNLDLETNPIKDDIALIKKQIAIQGSPVEKLDPRDAKLRAEIAESSSFINNSINQAFANNPGLSRPIRIINPASIDKFDDPILGYNPKLSDIQQEDLYERNLQSGFYGGLIKPLTKGIISRGASIVPKIIQNAGHVGGWALDMGLIGAGVQDKLNFAFDNAIVNVASQADEGLRKMFPIYADEKYYNGNLLDQMFSTKFWTDDLFDGVAFAIASLAPAKFPQFVKGKYFGKVRTALGMKPSVKPTTVGDIAPVEMPNKLPNYLQSTFMTEEALINSGLPKARIESVLNTKNWLKSGAFLGYNTIGEAGFEAFDTKKQIKEELISKYNYSEEDADRIASEKAADTFKINAIGLLASNYAELKLLLGNKFFASVNSDVNKAKRAFLSGAITAEEAKQSLKKGFGTLAKGMAVEGFYEENFQTAIQQYEKDHIFDSPDFIDTVQGTVDNMFSNVRSLGKGLLGMDVTQKEKEGGISIILGAIIGGGMGKVSQIQENKEMKGAIDSWSKALTDLKNPQHAIMAAYGNNKKQLYKKREITKEDGTKDFVYTDQNGNFEVDQDVLFNFAFTQSHNKIMMEKYADAVSKGDTKAADFYLNQFFVRQAFQHFGKSIFGGDVDMAAENLKYLLSEVSPEDDSDTKNDVEMLAASVDAVAKIYKDTVEQVNDKYGINQNPYGYELYKNNTATAAIYYERTKQDWFNKLKQKGLSPEKQQEVDQIIKESQEEVNNFLDRSKSEQIFNPAIRTNARIVELSKELEKVDGDTTLTVEQRKRKKTLLNLEYRKILIQGDKDPIEYRLMDISAEKLKTFDYTGISFSKRPFLNALEDIKITRSLESKYRDVIESIDKLRTEISVNESGVFLTNVQNNIVTLDTLITQLQDTLELYDKKSSFTPEDYERYQNLYKAFNSIYNKLKPNEEGLKNKLEFAKERYEDLNTEYSNRVREYNDIVQNIQNQIPLIISQNPEKLEGREQEIFDTIYNQQNLGELKEMIEEIQADIVSAEETISSSDLLLKLNEQVSKVRETELKRKSVDLKSKTLSDLERISIEEFYNVENKEDLFDRIVLLQSTQRYDAIKNAYDKLKESGDLKDFNIPPNSITSTIDQLEALQEMYNMVGTTQIDTSDPTSVYYNTLGYSENSKKIKGKRVFLKSLNNNFVHAVYVDDANNVVYSEISSTPEFTKDFKVVFEATKEGTAIGTAKYYVPSIDQSNRNYTEKVYNTIKLNSEELGRMLDRQLTYDELIERSDEVKTYVSSLAKGDSNYIKSVLNSLTPQDRQSYKTSREEKEIIYSVPTATETSVPSELNADLLNSLPKYISDLKELYLPLAEENYNIKENSQQVSEIIYKQELFSQFGITVNPNTGEYNIFDPELYSFVSSIINKDQLNSILEKAKQDKVDPFSIVYYERIIESLKNKSGISELVKSRIVDNSKSTVELVKNLKDSDVKIVVQQAQNNESIFDKDLAGVQFDPDYFGFKDNQQLETYLASNPVQFLNYIFKRHYPKIESGSIIDLFRVDQNIVYLYTRLTTDQNLKLGTDSITKNELTDIVGRIIQINSLSTLNNNLTSDFSLKSFLGNLKELNTPSPFALSREQRIAALELYKFLNTSPKSKNLSEVIAFLNAGAATGKTTLLKQVMGMMPNINTDNTLAISDFESASKVVRDGIPQLAKQPVTTFDQIFSEGNIKAILQDSKRVITVGERELDLDKLNYLIIDEAAMLEGSSFDNLSKVINKLNEGRGATKLKVILTGDTNQLRKSGYDLRFSDLYGAQNYKRITPLFTAYRASVPIIENTYQLFKGNGTVVKNLIGNSTAPLGEDAVGVNFVNSNSSLANDEFRKQIQVSVGTKLVITNDVEKYQGMDGVEVMSFREAQSLTRDNVFIDINPSELIIGKDQVAPDIAYNTIMYVAISRATKYALVKDYTNTSRNILDVNLQDEIAFERKSFQDGIQKSKQKTLEIIDHQLSLLEAIGIAKVDDTDPVDNSYDGDAAVDVPTADIDVNDQLMQDDKNISMDTEEQREEAFTLELEKYPALRDSSDENVIRALEVAKDSIVQNKTGTISDSDIDAMSAVPREFRNDLKNLLLTLTSKLPC